MRPCVLSEKCTADCGESGSTLRFLLPVAAALGIETDFKMHGRLPERPLAPLDSVLIEGGCRISRPERDVLRIQGTLLPGDYSLPGNISSQYITGMLLALTLAGAGSLEITGKTESAAYIDMTLSAMEIFGARPEKTDVGYRITGKKFISPGEIQVEGDWSNAAFWLCAAKIGKMLLELTGLDPFSPQGDRRIVSELAAMEKSTGEYVIDASGIPDLVPAIAAYACLKPGRTRFIHAERLRIKESDRLETVANTLGALGADIRETDDGLIIEGKETLAGGSVSASNDHRIAMMAAIASIGCENCVEIIGAEAVNKSYPAFWSDFNALGGHAILPLESW